MPATPPRPDVNALRVAKFIDALIGGTWADAEEAAAAAHTGRVFPGRRRRNLLPGGDAGEQVYAAKILHARFATYGVTGGAAGVVFAACGYPNPAQTPRPPDPPDPHAAALAAEPAARFVYADDDPRIVLACAAALEGAQVSACAGKPDEPRELLGLPEVAEISGPIQVQAQLCGHWWSPGLARHLIADYARLLPPRSTFLLSLGIPSDEPAGKEFAAGLEAIGGTAVYAHTEKDIASWFTAAGMRFLGDGQVKGVRGHGRNWAARLARPHSPGRIVYVTAVRP